MGIKKDEERERDGRKKKRKQEGKKEAKRKSMGKKTKPFLSLVEKAQRPEGIAIP